MVVHGLAVDKFHSPEVTAALIDLARLSQDMGTSIIETRSTKAKLLLERLLILCTGQGKESLNNSRGAILLKMRDSNKPGQQLATASSTTRPFRVLALHEMNEEEACAILTAFPTPEHQAHTLAVQFSEPVEATIAVTRPLATHNEYCWVTYRLPISESKVANQLPPGNVTGSEVPFPVTFSHEPVQVLLVLGWASVGDGGCAPTAEGACALLPLVADAVAAVIVSILQAQRIGELENAATREALREVDRLKGELLGTVSHELRSPLAAIKGYAATLLRHERRLPREERREFLLAINEASDRLEVIINRLLEMSQLETGTVKIERAPVDIVHLVQEAIIAAEERLEQHPVGTSDRTFAFKLDLETDSGMPSLDEPLVLADQRRLREVLDNLLENAIIYSPEGGTIKVTLRPVIEDQQCGASQSSSGYCSCANRADILVLGENCRRMLEICVADTGMGIPPEQLSRIFERFHRIDNRLTREVSGLGLGLAICKRIVELHDGAIWAESESGKGSKFYVWLPIDEEK